MGLHANGDSAKHHFSHKLWKIIVRIHENCIEKKGNLIRLFTRPKRPKTTSEYSRNKKKIRIRFINEINEEAKYDTHGGFIRRDSIKESLQVGKEPWTGSISAPAQTFESFIMKCVNALLIFSIVLLCYFKAVIYTYRYSDPSLWLKKSL